MLGCRTFQLSILYPIFIIYFIPFWLFRRVSIILDFNIWSVSNCQFSPNDISRLYLILNSKKTSLDFPSLLNYQFLSIRVYNLLPVLVFHIVPNLICRSPTLLSTFLYNYTRIHLYNGPVVLEFQSSVYIYTRFCISSISRFPGFNPLNYIRFWSYFLFLICI